MNVNDSIFRALAIMNVTVGAFIPQKNINAKSMIYNPLWYLWLKTIHFDKVLSDYKCYIFLQSDLVICKMANLEKFVPY